MIILMLQRFLRTVVAGFSIKYAFYIDFINQTDGIVKGIWENSSRKDFVLTF